MLPKEHSHKDAFGHVYDALSYFIQLDRQPSSGDGMILLALKMVLDLQMRNLCNTKAIGWQIVYYLRRDEYPYVE